jgi:3-oxoacyl-[acyl-carrier protein] reductase
MNIRSKTALVTGASRGIGKAIAIELAHRGIGRLLILARNAEGLNALAADLKALGTEVIALPVDLTDSIAVNVTLSQAWRDWGPIHLLVNCAGVAYQSPFLAAKLPDMHQELAINLMGMYTVTRIIGRRMVSQKEGTIVNVASLMGKIAAPTMATYSATKFGIIGFTQALRGELAPHNVRAISLLPSLTDTDMVRSFDLFRGVIPTSSEQVAKALIRGIERDATEIVVGWQSHLALWCDRFLPLLTEKIVRLAAPIDRDRVKLFPSMPRLAGLFPR